MALPGVTALAAEVHEGFLFRYQPATSYTESATPYLLRPIAYALPAARYPLCVCCNLLCGTPVSATRYLLRRTLLTHLL
eukprot:1029436-Rhodomonas_salina.3